MKPIYDPLLGKMRTELTAGAGLDISGGTISTITPPDGVPYIGGDGVAIDGATIYSDLTAGFHTEIAGGTVGQARYWAIEAVTGATVTLQAGHAYKASATTSALTLSAESVAANTIGQDGYIEIFVAGTGYVHAVPGVVALAGPLEPNAVNNCRIEFRDGLVTVTPENFLAGYIVVSSSGTATGSLPYGISSATQEYIAFDASLNGTTIDLSGSTANGEKHIVGNSYADTILTGAVNCGTSKFTVANLSLNNVSVSGGMMTLGDAFIPSGSTVAVSGGGLAIERVSGDGGTIDLARATNIGAELPVYASNVNLTGGTTMQNGGLFYVANSNTITMSGCSVYGNHAASNGGAIVATLGTGVELVSCTLTGNSAGGYGGAVRVNNGASCNLIACVVSGNTDSVGRYDINTVGGTVSIAGSTIGGVNLQSGVVELSGSNSIGAVTAVGQAKIGSAVIQSGAIVTLAGSIDPGSGGVTFAPGGATIIPGGSSASAYMLGGMTVQKLTNTNNLQGTADSPVITAFASSAIVSGVSLTNGTNYWGGAGRLTLGSSATFIDCVFSGNSSTQNRYYNALGVTYGGKATFSNCTFDSVTSQGVYINSGGTVTLCGTNTVDTLWGDSIGSVTISSGASINLTSSIAPGGGIQVVGGTCTVNGNVIESGTYTSIDSNGSATV